MTTKTDTHEQSGGFTRRGVLVLGAATAGAAWLAANSQSASATVLGLGRRGVTIPNAALPFSFQYKGYSSHDLLPGWQRQSTTHANGHGSKTTTITWSDPAPGLKVTWASTEFTGYATTSWRINFENTTATALTPITDVLALDITAEDLHTGNWQIRSLNGSSAQATDFEPYSLPLAADTFRVFTTGGGRPTDGYRGDTTSTAIGGAWPYYNVDGGDAGLIAAIGWPGQWAAEIERIGTTKLRISGGVSTAAGFSPNEHITDNGLTSVSLPGGESFESPLVILQPWDTGDWVDSQNVWRRWFVEHNLPRTQGKLPPPIVPTQANDYFVGQTDTINDELEWMNAYGAHNATAGTGGVHDYWWIDAGWYNTPEWPDPNTGWIPTGTWEPNDERFPDGLLPATARAKELGMKSIVWFEPERVMPGTWLYDNHPEWLLVPGPGDGQFGGVARILDFGNDDARAWAIEHFDGLIKSQGIDLYREDFNITPLSFWNYADVPELRASRQFSGVQGANNWRYQDNFDGEWADIATYSASGYLGQREWHGDGGYVWPGALHPGGANDTALVWIAPKAGEVSVLGNVAKVDPSGDGVVVSITLNDATIWGPQTIQPADFVGVPANVDHVVVVAGDAVRFVINRNGTNASDSTGWDPIVAYPEQMDEATQQRGYAQIRYVLGHFGYWQELRRRNPKLMIDDCASGGRRMDPLSLSVSIPLLRSDWVLQATGNQAHTHGLSLWVPYSGAAARITGVATDAYNARSAMAPSYHLALNVADPTADWNELKRLATEWDTIKDSWLGDYYPLTPHSVDETTQLAFQFQTQNGKTGFVQAFRRSQNTAGQLAVILRGLKSTARYQFTDLQTGVVSIKRGYEVMGSGSLTIVLPNAPSATTIGYRRL